MQLWQSIYHQCVDWIKMHRQSLATAFAVIQACVFASCVSSVRKPPMPSSATSNNGKPGMEVVQTVWPKSENLPRPIGGSLFAAERMSKVNLPKEFLDDGAAGKVFGRVTLQVRIGADGILRKVTVVEADHPALVTALVRELRAMSWQPAKTKGKPVEASFILPVMHMLISVEVNADRTFQLGKLLGSGNAKLDAAVLRELGEGTSKRGTKGTLAEGRYRLPVWITSTPSVVVNSH